MGRTPIGEREEHFRKLASVLRSKKVEYAKSMTKEIGKLISLAEAEVDKCASAAEVREIPLESSSYYL